MEELSMEEKAKAYDEAIERAKKWYNAPNIDKMPTYGNRVIEEIFPELAESKDERIRNEMISYFKQMNYDNAHTWNGINLNKFVVWLEKQVGQKLIDKIQLGKKYKCIASPRYSTFTTGEIYKPEDKFLCSLMNFCSDCFEPIEEDEQNPIKEHNACEFCEDRYGCVSPCSMKLIEEEKPTDKVEPKFKVGDWFVNNITKDVFLLKSVNNGYCTLEDTKGNTYSPCLFPIEDDNRLWTIQDAKAGDILEFGDHGRLVVGIVSYVNKTTGKVDVNCLLENNNFKVGNYYNLDTIKPHPVTKEQRDILFQKMKEAGYEWDAEKKELKKIEQKQVIDYPDSLPKDNWELVHDFVNKFRRIPKDEDELNALVVYVLKRQKPAEWSEEDERFQNVAINILNSSKVYTTSPNKYEDTINWLKSLKDRVLTQPKQGWGEEDEYNVAFIVETLLGLDGDKEYLSKYKSMANWLKSIKDRYTWKPSDEQITWLYRAADDASKDSRMKQILNELLSDLKKLREE